MGYSAFVGNKEGIDESVSRGRMIFAQVLDVKGRINVLVFQVW